MRILAFAVWAIGFSICGAAAVESRHDDRIARAAADIVAARMGELRGSLDMAHQAKAIPAEPATQRRPALPPSAGVWQKDGLAVAIERRSSASPDL